MDIQTQLYTIESFEKFLAQPENAGRNFELIEGSIHEKMSSSFVASVIAATIGTHTGNFAAEYNLGYVTGAHGSYILNDDNEFMPDVGFIRKEHLPDLPNRAALVPPDLAVEVVSPTDSIRIVQKKALHYLANGTRLVWVVHPAEKIVEVYRPGEGDDDARIQLLNMDDALDGGAVLPGFSLSVRDIFPAESTESPE